MALRTVYCLWLVLVLAAPRTLAKRSYDDLCDDIIAHAQQASHQHNAGNTAAAELEVSKATAAFNQARKQSPESPQAFANIANFYHNIQRFREAIEMWRETRVRTEDPAMKAYLTARAKFSEFGLYSVQRDRVYAKGQGNISEAVGYATQQLSVYYMPDVLYDIATMEVMLSERNASLELSARQHFKESQRVAYDAFQAGRKLLGDACAGALVTADDIPAHLGSGAAPGHVDIVANSSDVYGYQSGDKFLFQDGTVYLAYLHDVGLSGNDGIIVQRAKGHCSMFLSTAGAQEKLHLNVQLASTWNPGPNGALSWHDAFAGRFGQHGASLRKIRHVPRVVSLLQFTSHAYYHFLVECVGRLLLAQEVLLADPTVMVLVPRSTASAFIPKLLSLLPFTLDPARVLQYNTESNPDVRLTVGELIYPSWQLVRLTTPTNGVSLASVTPRTVLQRIRAAYVPEPPTTRPLVLFLTRKEVMRRLTGEAAVVALVEQSLVGAGRRLLVFEGANYSTVETRALFSAAQVVIGVHGGALANIVFCAAGTRVVELGFAASFSNHYAQMAAALDLRYYRVPLQPSDLGLGAAWVELGPGGWVALQDTLAAIAADLAHPHTEL